MHAYVINELCRYAKDRREYAGLSGPADLCIGQVCNSSGNLFSAVWYSVCDVLRTYKPYIHLVVQYYTLALHYIVCDIGWAFIYTATYGL